MKAKEWRSQARPLAAALPTGFRPMRFGFVREEEWVAQCLYADTSAFSARAFFLEAFAFPLFVPSPHLYFDYGFRVGLRWQAVTPEVVAATLECLPRLTAIASLDGLAKAAARPDVDLHHVELHLCVAILKKDARAVAGHRAALDAWRPTQFWEPEVLQRTRELCGVLDTEGLEGGVRALAERGYETRKLLR